MAENNIATNVNDVVKRYQIESLNLQSPTIGHDIVSRFESINQNFAKLIESDYLKGAKGDSVVTKKITLSKEYHPENVDGYNYYVNLVSIIVSGLPDEIRNNFLVKTDGKVAGINQNFSQGRFDSLDGAELTLIYEIIDGEQNKTLLTCLPFTYKDPLFGTITKEINGTIENTGANVDLSCIICYDDTIDENGNTVKDFFRSSLVPTVHYDDEAKRFNWTINGVKTGLAAEGPQGEQGKTGTGIIVAEYEVEEENGVSYNKITRFHFHVDNNTVVDQSSVEDNNGWIDVDSGTFPKELRINLVDNCMVFARKKEDDTTTGEVTNPETANGDIEISEKEWIWGLLFVDNSVGQTPIYKIRQGGSLSEILCLGTHTLLNLMKINRYNFIPHFQQYHEPKKDGTSNDENYRKISGVDDVEGHVLYSSGAPAGRYDDGFNTEGYSVQRTLNIGPSQKTSSVTHILNSEYDKNYFNKVYIGNGDSTKDEVNYIKLGLPTQKDSDFCAYFPNPVQGTMESAQKLTTLNKGSEETPVYFSDGVPVTCSNELNVNIKGNAATANSAEEANKLTVSAGSPEHPVYFLDGVPTPCRNIDTQVDKALNAGRLTKTFEDASGVKIVSENDSDAYDIGSPNKAIYFEDGVPVECDDSLNHDISGTAAKADVLTKDDGDATHPVYFKKGIPVKCNDSLDVNISGNAATASKLITKTRSSLIGSNKLPVYFKDGVPVACDGVLGVSITGNAATASALGGKITVGSIDSPVYFKDGVPVACNISSISEAAKKLTVNAGSASNPVYFKDGVPVACNGALGLSITGNAATATKLATARKIDITGGITTTEQNFDGSSNINIPVTSINENYLNWGGGKQQIVGPIDMAMASYLNANRLSFMPSNNIKVEYSNNGDSSKPEWKDYGLTDDQKTSLVTTGLGTTLYMGKKSNGSQNPKKDLLRIEITAKNGNLYFSLKKIMLQISTNGAAGCYVIVDKKMNGSTSFTNVGKYAISGWSGWNAITCNSSMGGTFTTAINTVRLTFGFDSYYSGYGSTNTKFCLMKIGMHGENCWTNKNSQMAETGNLYSWDVNQGASFPSNLEAPVISAEKMVCNDIDGDVISAKTIKAESSGSIIGSSNTPWNTAYIKNLKSTESADINQADIETAVIKEAIIEKLKLSGDFGLGHIKIQDDFPSSPSNTSKNISYTVSNTPSWYTINSDVISKKSKSVNISSITLKTSALPDAENNTIDVKIPKMIIPIAVTYMNDYDDVKEWKWQGLKSWWVTNRYWADIYLCDLKVTITCSGKIVTKTFNNIGTPTHWVYDGNKRHLFIAYPAIPEFTINDIVLSKSGGKYKDITVSVKFDYSITRTNTPEGHATNSRVGYIYIPGVKLHNTVPANYSKQYEYSSTEQPSSTLPSKISSTSSHNGTVTGTYIPKSGESAIYLTKKGIRIVRDGSYVEIVAPQNNSKWEEDASGYVHMCIVGSNTKYHRKKRLSDILAGGTTWED